MHQCAEFFFRVRVPPPPSLEELLRFYEQSWLPNGYESAEEEANYKAYGRELLTRFWEIHHPGFRMPLAVERLFCVDVEGIKLRGYFDRVDKLNSGGLAIVDYKTNYELFTNEDLENSLQLTLYQLAAEKLWQLPVEGLTLYHMRSNTSCSCAPRNQEQLTKATQLVLEVAQNIACQRFPAIERPACPCDFPEHCPYHRYLYMGDKPELESQERVCSVVTADTIEQYTSLQQEIKALQARLEEIRQVIISYCEAQGLNRVYGRENAITYKMVEMTDYDEAEVRAILEPQGLWERVLSLNPSRLKQLLADESVASDIRDRLNALRQITSLSPRLWVRKLREEDNPL
jgi:putative RecB family exonuclease